jgi:hypothetical protein
VHNSRKGREGKEIAQCYLYVTIHNRVVPEASVSCVMLCLFTLCNLLPFPFNPVPSLPLLYKYISIIHTNILYYIQYWYCMIYNNIILCNKNITHLTQLASQSVLRRGVANHCSTEITQTQISKLSFIVLYFVHTYICTRLCVLIYKDQWICIMSNKHSMGVCNSMYIDMIIWIYYIMYVRTVYIHLHTRLEVVYVYLERPMDLYVCMRIISNKHSMGVCNSMIYIHTVYLCVSY